MSQPGKRTWTTDFRGADAAGGASGKGEADCASCVLEGNKERIELLIRKYVLESFFVTWLLDSTATM